MERLEELRQCFQRDGEERQRVFDLRLADMNAQAQKQSAALVESLVNLTGDSKQLSRNSLDVVSQSKKIVAEIKDTAIEMKQSTEQTDRFNRRTTKLIIALVVIQILLALFQAYLNRKPVVIPPIIIQSNEQKQPDIKAEEK